MFNLAVNIEKSGVEKNTHDEKFRITRTFIIRNFLCFIKCPSQGVISDENCSTEILVLRENYPTKAAVKFRKMSITTMND